MLLAIATLAWTLASCARRRTSRAARSAPASGSIVLGGYGFAWPLTYLLPLLGLAWSPMRRRACARRSSRAQLGRARRRSPTRRGRRTSPRLTGALRALGDEGHRADHARRRRLASTVVVGERTDARVALRIERIGGALRASIVAVRRRAPRRRAGGPHGRRARRGRMAPGSHPEPPPADAAVPHRRRRRSTTASRAAAGRSRSRCSTTACARAPSRRSTAGSRTGSRGPALSRVSRPRRAARSSDAAVGSRAQARRHGAADRLVAVVELLVEIAARGEVAALTPPPEPEQLA